MSTATKTQITISLERLVPRGHGKLGLGELQVVIDSILESPFHAQTLRAAVIERLGATDPGTRQWAVNEVYRFEDLVSQYKPEIFSEWLERQAEVEAEQAAALHAFNEALSDGTIDVQASPEVQRAEAQQRERLDRAIRANIRGDADYMRRHLPPEMVERMKSRGVQQASIEQLEELLEELKLLRARLDADRAQRARDKEAAKEARRAAKEAARADQPAPAPQAPTWMEKHARIKTGRPNQQGVPGQSAARGKSVAGAGKGTKEKSRLKKNGK
jgi:ribonuclease HI